MLIEIRIIAIAPIQLSIEKQLWDRIRPWRLLTGLDLGESKLLNINCFTADINSSFGFGDGVRPLNLLQKFIWRFRASSLPIRLSDDLIISSFTASAHSPQIHRPSFRSLTLPIYAAVQSSVNPQHSHFTNSTSFIFAFAVADLASVPASTTAAASLLITVSASMPQITRLKTVTYIFSFNTYTQHTITASKIWNSNHKISINAQIHH